MNNIKQILAMLSLVSLLACTPADIGNRAVGELASDRIELTAEVTEPIVEIAVPEGATVGTGQLLVRQNSDRATARLAEAEARLAQVAARLDELVRGPRSEQINAARANVDGAVLDLEFRTAEYQRAKRVHERKLSSPEAVDRAKAAFDAAQAYLDVLRLQLEEMLTGTTVEELAQAEQNVKQAEARRDFLQVDLDRHELRAPTDGIVDSRLFEQGERPAQGQPVMVMLAGQQPYARVYVPEILRVKVSAGTSARIYVDGLDEPIEGRVRWVASEAAFTPYYALTEKDRGHLSFVAKVDIVESRERLPDGIPVEVEFLVDGAE